LLDAQGRQNRSSRGLPAARKLHQIGVKDGWLIDGLERQLSPVSQRSMPTALFILGYEFGLPGTTCRLADRPCPLAGRLIDMPLSWLTSVAASVPSDIIDSDLPCCCPPGLLPGATLGGTGDRRPPAVDGVCNDKAGRCPRRCGGGSWDAKEELRDIEGLVEECTGGSLRCRSPPVAKPFCFRAGERSRPSGRATFLKVIVHSMSSPANTVESFQCTNARMFDADMVERTSGTGCGRGSSSSGAIFNRHDGC
jgi:hypothetical protein